MVIRYIDTYWGYSIECTAYTKLVYKYYACINTWPLVLLSHFGTTTVTHYIREHLQPVQPNKAGVFYERHFAHFAMQIKWASY